VVKKIKAKGKKKKTEEGSKSEPLSLEELKAQMQKAVEAEDYEAAAKFRDEYRLRKGQES
jgi:protein-arginine kinase activator protein McsA